MAPFLATIKSFEDVPVTDAGVETEGGKPAGIDTLTFLEAAEGLVKLFDLLGSVPLKAVQSDLQGNIKKVRARYDAAPDVSATLEALVENETDQKKPATQGLVWLIRGLAFTCKALLATQGDPTLELSPAFSQAYEVTLKAKHNFVAKGIFAVAMKAVPYRATLYTKLAEDPEGEPVPADKLNEALNKWLAALDKINQRMEAYFAQNGYDKKF